MLLQGQRESKTNDIHAPFDLLSVYEGYEYCHTVCLTTPTSSSLTRWLGSAFCVMPKLVPSCFTTEITTSRPADAGNLFRTLKHCAPQLLALICADNDAHSEYIISVLWVLHTHNFPLFCVTSWCLWKSTKCNYVALKHYNMKEASAVKRLLKYI